MEMKMNPDFNGGKMKHLFNYEVSQEDKKKCLKYVPEFNNTDYNPSYPINEELDVKLAQESAERAMQALLLGTIYVKIDGSNHRIVFEDGIPVIYARLDDKKRKINVDELPEDTITLGPGNITKLKGHKYFFVRKPRNMPGKIGAIYNQMYDALDSNIDYVKSFNLPQISFEAVGKKFNNTPNIHIDAGIALHRDQVIQLHSNSRHFEGIRTLLLESELIAEGIVVEHQGIFWKIRADLFQKGGHAGRKWTPPVILN
jgi:hypothetical protein